MKPAALSATSVQERFETDAFGDTREINQSRGTGKLTSDASVVFTFA